MIIKNLSFLDTGNEPIIEGVRITQDRLKNINLNGELDENELVFYVESSEDCRDECNGRYINNKAKKL